MPENKKAKSETAADGADVVAAKKAAEKKPAVKKPAAKKPAAKKPAAPKKEEPAPADPAKEQPADDAAADVPAESVFPTAGSVPAAAEQEEATPAADREEQDTLPSPRRSVAFIGAECYPFIKTGGLGDVMYALPRALVKQNCDVKVILPRYRCIPQEYQDKMVYRGEFYMDLLHQSG